MLFNNGSFRDPHGRVFEHDNTIFRALFEPGHKDFLAAGNAGIYDKLIDAGMLIPHKKTAPPALQVPEQQPVLYLAHPRLKMVSYPWEWTFSMLKDAALLHLEIMSCLIPEGFWLRDASAFNIQYDGEKLRLIDTLSIGPKVKDSPWVAYGQFCSHFLAPLALAAYGDIRTLSMWERFIDGFPLDLAINLLPSRKVLRPGLLMHLMIHAKCQQSADKKENLGRSEQRPPKISDLKLHGLINSLKKTVNHLHWRRESPIWEDYGDIRIYGGADVAAKKRFVDQVLRQLRPELVWDLGANTGEFSLIAAKNGAFVVSIDGDAACMEQLYRKVRDEHITNILPLTMDLSNPSPAIGWHCAERMSLMERGPADVVLALALIHHLVFSGCIPLPLIAEWLARMARVIIVEFVPETDPMVVKLSMRHNKNHHPYSSHAFREAFLPYFRIQSSITLKNGRELYHLSRTA